QPVLFHAARRPTCPPFPYTTLFRSRFAENEDVARLRLRIALHAPRIDETDDDEAVDGLDGVDAVSARDRNTGAPAGRLAAFENPDRKSTRLNSSHEWISYAVFCLKK